MLAPIWILVISLVIVYSASFIQGLSGFGSALVMVPLLVLFFPPKTVIPVSLMIGTALNLIISVRERRSLQGKRILPLLIAGAAGIPVGMLILLVVEGDIIRLVIGLVICITAILLLSGLYLRIGKEKLALLPVGFVSGVLNGSISMSGPPVVLFFSNQKLKKGNFRANLVTYFIFLNILTYPVFLIGGLFTTDVLILSALTAPGMVLGLITGLMLSGKVEEAHFKRIALILVVVTGLSALVSGITGLI